MHIHFITFFVYDLLLNFEIILIQPYDQREALGQSWLKGLEDGKYFKEEYIAHLGKFTLLI